MEYWIAGIIGAPALIRKPVPIVGAGYGGTASSRQVQILHLQPGEPMPGLPPEIGGLPAALETFDLLVLMDETAKIYGVSLTSLDELALRNVNSAHG